MKIKLWAQKVATSLYLAGLSQETRRAFLSEFDRSYYLTVNPDVRAAGDDPLFHYLRFGWQEGRNPNPTFDTNFYLADNKDVAKARINPLLHYISKGAAEGRRSRPPPHIWRAERINQWAAAANRAEPIKPEALAEAFRNGITSSRMLVSVSHDDFEAGCGGIQTVIGAEQRAARHFGWNYLHIAPAAPLPMLAEPMPASAFRASLRLDGQHLGIVNFDELLEAVAVLRRDGMRLDCVVHHFMGHAPELILKLIEASGAEEPVIWTHDFFTICPSYALLSNDLAFCGAPALDTAACQACCYHTERRDHQKRMQSFFDATRPTVAAPSDIALGLWRSQANFAHREAIVVPPGQLALSEPVSREPLKPKPRPLRIAHLGARAFHKGWHIFEQLSSDFARDERYAFLQLGSAEGSPGGQRRATLRNIPVRVTAETPNAMAEAVTNAEIDVAVIWSLCYETFNITVHEALAGGAFVVVRAAAGNCWPAVLANAPDQGCAVADENELFALFKTNALREQVEKSQRRRGTFVRGSGATAWLSRVPLP
jgi:hypothetical protein